MPKPVDHAEKEIRSLSFPVEIRADENDGTVTVEGYAAVFDEITDIGGRFREVFLPGCFREAITRDDVVFLVEHWGLPLARSTAGKGTLELKEDKRGLHMRAVLDMTDPDVQRVVPKMRRGDLSKMSIAFLAIRQEWVEEDTENEESILRRIGEARLFDVSIVTTPAYDGTEIGLRALEVHNRKSEGVGAVKASQLRLKMKSGLRDRKAR